MEFYKVKHTEQHAVLMLVVEVKVAQLASFPFVTTRIVCRARTRGAITRPWAPDLRFYVNPSQLTLNHLLLIGGSELELIRDRDRDSVDRPSETIRVSSQEEVQAENNEGRHAGSHPFHQQKYQ